MASNHFTYNALLNAFAKALQWPQSLQLLREMPPKRLRPDLISFNASLEAAEEQWQVAIQLFGRWVRPRKQVEWSNGHLKIDKNQ